MIEAVLLDAGGVLVHPSWSAVAGVLAEAGIAADVARLAHAELRVAREIDEAALIGRTDDARRLPVFFRRVIELSGVDRHHPALDAAVDGVLRAHARDNLWRDVPAEVPGALGRLKAAGLRLAVVSNANGSVARKLEEVGLAGFFDRIVDSAVVGVEKPDPRIFAFALGGLATADTALHAGDLFHVDVLGARAAGLRAVLLDRGGLHADRDCERVASLGGLCDLLGVAGY